MRLGLLALLVLTTSCNRKVEKEQCAEMVRHMVDLLSKDKGKQLKGKVENDASAAIDKTCVGKITRAQYDCVMAATSFDDAAACDK